MAFGNTSAKPMAIDGIVNLLSGLVQLPPGVPYSSYEYTID